MLIAIEIRMYMAMPGPGDTEPARKCSEGKVQSLVLY